MSQPRQITIVPGSIDHNKAVALRQCINGIGECFASCGILRIIVFTEAKMVGDLEVATNVLSPSMSVFNIMGTSNNDDFVVGSTAVAARRSFSLLIWRGCVSAFCGRRPVQGSSGEPRHYAAAIRSSVTSRRIL